MDNETRFRTLRALRRAEIELAYIRAQLEPAQEPAEMKPAKFGAWRWSDCVFGGVLDNAVREVLASNKTMEWSAGKLADALAPRDDMSGFDAEAIRKNGLRTLKDTLGTYTRRAYDPAKARWRYCD